jgi:hypothetical protein
VAQLMRNDEHGVIGNALTLFGKIKFERLVAKWRIDFLIYIISPLLLL